MRRRANITWLSGPPGGSGRARVDSHAFTELPISAPGEAAPHDGQATPGELLAAAIGAIYLEALSQILLRDGTPARELVVDVDVDFSFEEPGHRLTEVSVAVHGRVPAIEPEGFERAAEAALRSSRHLVGVEDRIPTRLSATLHAPNR
jgi:organic hydroperoxide reductase OsmC/OhrA